MSTSFHGCVQGNRAVLVLVLRFAPFGRAAKDMDMYKTCVALLVAMLLSVGWPHAQTPAATTAAVDSNRLFGLDLYKRLVGDEPTANVFVSPLSLTMALSMVTEGARGTTRTQMDRVLHVAGTGADSLASRSSD